MSNKLWKDILVPVLLTSITIGLLGCNSSTAIQNNIDEDVNKGLHSSSPKNANEESISCFMAVLSFITDFVPVFHETK